MPNEGGQEGSRRDEHLRWRRHHDGTPQVTKQECAQREQVRIQIRQKTKQADSLGRNQGYMKGIKTEIGSRRVQLSKICEPGNQARPATQIGTY